MVVPWNEQAAVNPISPYGISKWIVESYLGVLAPASAVTILRLSNIYGPRQGAAGEAGVVATFLDRMQRGLPVEIHGDGEQTRDLLYVGDAVDAIQAALGQRSSGTFNIGTGLGTTVNALFKQMAELLRYTLQPAFGPERVGDIRESVLDPTHALSTLGWRPRTSLRSGLSMTIAGFVKSSVDR
jgi:UDP-glucose 4-epimerase